MERDKKAGYSRERGLIMTVVNLGLLTPDEGMQITGGGTINNVGSIVSSGDVNGDGFDDMIVLSGYGGNTGYVIFGSASGLDDVNLYTLDPADGVHFGAGATLSSAGDVNGDGFDDLVTGVAGDVYYDYYYGSLAVTYVSFGGASGVTSGFSITGESYYTPNVASAGDVNGDGFDDIIIGDTDAHSNGTVYVIFGKESGFSNIDLSSLSATDGFSISGEASGDQAGTSVASAGDVNGDGFDDIIIGADYNGDGGDFAGASYVIFGKADGFTNIDLATMTSADGFRIIGEADDRAGYKVSSAGDINGDGFDDILVAAPHFGGTGVGAVYVIFGKASGFSDIDLGALAPADGFKISDDANIGLGRSVSSAGDFNGDGYDDIIVGAPFDEASGTYAGAAYVIYGKAGGFTDIDLSSLAEADGFKIIGDDSGDGVGFSVSSAGDVNGDGYDDLMIGAAGRSINGVGAVGDVYILYGHATVGVVVGGTDGPDTITGGNLDDTLDGRGGNDILAGLGGNDTLIGGSGNDQLDGGLGADTMFGGTGNDTYVVNSLNDVIVERSGEGNDTVVSSLTYILGANLENLTLTGTAAINGTGSSVANVITGNSGANVLDGGAGADILNGGIGADKLLGGDGNDTLNGGPGNDTLNGGLGVDTATYSDAAAGVTVQLITTAQNTIGAGTDTLAAIENLTGSAFNDTLTGSTAANVLTGNDGNDALNGRGGSDTLNGGNGNDTLNGGDGNDVLAGGAGTDAATYAFAASAVSVNLALTSAQATGGAGSDTLTGIENLVGSNYGDTLSGNTLANTIDGGAGNDTISGGAANDTLTGGAGNDWLDGGSGSDTLNGGANADSFVFSSALNAASNVDTISGFVVADDTILLSSAIFTAAGVDGTLSASAFHVGTAAADADDRIIYDQATGRIYYDADGNGAGAKTLFATVAAGTALTNLDFRVYSSASPAASAAVSSSATTDQNVASLHGGLEHLPFDPPSVHGAGHWLPDNADAAAEIAAMLATLQPILDQPYV